RISRRLVRQLSLYFPPLPLHARRNARFPRRILLGPVHYFVNVPRRLRESATTQTAVDSFGLEARRRNRDSGYLCDRRFFGGLLCLFRLLLNSGSGVSGGGCATSLGAIA